MQLADLGMFLTLILRTLSHQQAGGSVFFLLGSELSMAGWEMLSLPHPTPRLMEASDCSSDLHAVNRTTSLWLV